MKLLVCLQICVVLSLVHLNINKADREARRKPNRGPSPFAKPISLHILDRETRRKPNRGPSPFAKPKRLHLLDREARKKPNRGPSPFAVPKGLHILVKKDAVTPEINESHPCMVWVSGCRNRMVVNKDANDLKTCQPYYTYEYCVKTACPNGVKLWKTARRLNEKFDFHFKQMAKNCERFRPPPCVQKCIDRLLVASRTGDEATLCVGHYEYEYCVRGTCPKGEKIWTQSFEVDKKAHYLFERLQKRCETHMPNPCIGNCSAVFMVAVKSGDEATMCKGYFKYEHCVKETCPAGEAVWETTHKKHTSDFDKLQARCAEYMANPCITKCVIAFMRAIESGNEVYTCRGYYQYEFCVKAKCVDGEAIWERTGKSNKGTPNSFSQLKKKCAKYNFPGVSRWNRVTSPKPCDE